MPKGTNLTNLLRRWQQGDASLEGRLMDAIYPELRILSAHRLAKEGQYLTLQTTELVNEAFLRITKLHGLNLQDRHHFYAIAAKVVRGIVIDQLRHQRSMKAGGGLPFVPLEQADADVIEQLDDSVDWLAVDLALRELERADPQSGQVVELKFFAGLSNQAVATALGLSEATIVRRWRFAKAWLYHKLSDQPTTPP